jgi:periplasmic protein TonB
VRQVEARSAVGNLQGLISGDDYPASALEREEEGAVTVSLTIGTNGRVSGCSVTSSSGSRALDQATCRILQGRARFTPARDSNGNPTTDTFTQRIRWQLQG